MNEIRYREDANASESYKKDYLHGIEQIIANREQKAFEERKDYRKQIFCNQEKYREDLREMLGWPLTEKEICEVPVAKLDKLAEEADINIYRATIQIMEGFEITGLFYQRKEKKLPLVIVQHGKEGTPELISNVYGNTFNYNHMAERVLESGVHVFAPQLLLWNKENYPVDYDRDNLDARLKRVGSSITALELYALMRILDYFEHQEYVANFGMVGLSYGGFYTLFATALDVRIKEAVSCSFFNKREDNAWTDWTWKNSAFKFNDAEVACLIYPRKLWIEVGINDEAFVIEGARAERNRLEEMCKEVGLDWIEYIEFDGAHEFCLDDEPLMKLASTLSNT